MKDRCRLFFLVVIVVATVFAHGVVANEASSKQTEWVPGWKNGPEMSVARSGAAIIEIDGVIHVIGGVDGKDFLRSTEYVKVGSDGAVSEWRQGPKLNVERGFFSAVKYKNHVYVAGGGRGPFGKILLDTVERAEIKPDGTLGEWVLEKNILNIERRCSRLAVIGGYLFAFGGFGGILLDTVESAEILPDGSLDEWLVSMDNMTVPRYIHGVQQVGEKVYVVGGHDQEKGLGITDVEWSLEDEPGLLQPWSKAPALQKGRYGLESVRHGDYLYALGGLDGSAYLDSVEKAPIDKEGNLGNWRYTTPLASRREGMNVIVISDHIYVIGGTNLDGYARSIEYATFDDKGDIGYWADSAEAKLKKQEIAQRETSKRVLPNEAMVVKHIKTQGYSYLVVQRQDGLQLWLAGPVMDIRLGSLVKFPNGVVMQRFYSKELKREFPVIMFVGEVRIVKEPPPRP